MTPPGTPLLRALRGSILSLALLGCVTRGAPAPAPAAAGGPRSGTLILTGGEMLPGVLARFVELAGGAGAEIVYVPTAASSIRLESGYIFDPPDSGASPKTAEFETELARLFGVRRVTVLHTRDRAATAHDGFVGPLRRVRGLWLSSGNAGRLIDAYLDTRVQRELEALLARGGVVGGNSAGAIIQGSFVIRGRADKPVLVARGRERGFGFLRGVAIDPHLLSQKRETELVTVLDAHPDLLGIGLADSAAIEVRGDRVRAIGGGGNGRVLIYDNRKHGCCWYYFEPDHRDPRRHRPGHDEVADAFSRPAAELGRSADIRTRERRTMSKVFVNVGLSLDGYMAPEGMTMHRPEYRNWGAKWGAMMAWILNQQYFRENVLKLGSGGETGPVNDLVRSTNERIGANIMGKRMFDQGEIAWPEEAPFHTPVYVLTNAKREPWVRPGGTTFYFVNDGPERALELARASAGSRDVRIAGGADVIQQYLNLGVVEELEIALAPVLFGGGRRLFENLREPRPQFRVDRVLDGPAATHVRYVRQ